MNKKYFKAKLKSARFFYCFHSKDADSSRHLDSPSSILTRVCAFETFSGAFTTLTFTLINDVPILTLALAPDDVPILRLAPDDIPILGKFSILKLAAWLRKWARSPELELTTFFFFSISKVIRIRSDPILFFDLNIARKFPSLNSPKIMLIISTNDGMNNMVENEINVR